jgi:hypothetical protein
MSELADALIARGLVAPDVLNHAQVAASAADVTLAEALLDMGAVSEEQLLELFHHALGYPLVDTGYFDKVDPRTLALLPRDLAVQHRVLPLYRAGKRLFVAAIDPLAKARLAEIAFVSGHEITVCVAKTSAVLRGLAARYQVTLPPLKLKAKPRAKIEPLAVEELTLPKVPAPAIAAPRPASRAAAAVAVDKAEPGALKALFEQAPRTAAPETKRDNTLPRAYEFTRAREELGAAEDADGVGRVVVGFVSRFFPRVVLLAHRQEMLIGWHTAGAEISPARLKGIIVPLHVSSVFRQVVESRSYHIGPLPPGMINSAFLSAVGDKPAGHTLVVPIVVEKKVAIVLYADTAGAPAPVQDLSELYRLCEEAGRAFDNLIRGQR